jgi:methenyltetrahydromethanopterin cyclohydrolase
MREAGIAVPDDVLIENSRLQRKSEISKRMQNDQNGPEAQAAAALKQRANEAEVASMEADAINKRADADLKAAKTKQAIAAIAQEDARIEIEAGKAEAAGDGPEKAQQEMALNQQKQGHEMALAEQKQEHEISLAEREHGIKEQQAAHDAELKQAESETRRAAELRASTQPQQPTKEK